MREPFGGIQSANANVLLLYHESYYLSVFRILANYLLSVSVNMILSSGEHLLIKEGRKFS